MNPKELKHSSLANKPSLLKSLRSNNKYAHTALKDLPKHMVNAQTVLCIENAHELCLLLNASFSLIENQINYPNYRYYTIPKKKGGKRHIAAPDKALKNIQKRLNYYLQGYYLSIKPSSVHGFVIYPCYIKGRCNIADNASIHVGQNHLLNIDLKDFFTSISAARVKACFKSELFNYSESLCNALTLLTTVHGTLPTGSPTSPVISNLVCWELDQDLAKFAAENNLKYSRYADDLSFSSLNPIDESLTIEISAVIQKHRFTINNKKVRLKHAGQRMVVTGLTVNEKVNIPRHLLKNVRAMLHDLHSNGLASAASKHLKQKENASSSLSSIFLNRLTGLINFIGQIRGKDDHLYLKFSLQLKACLSQV
jgi:RNA-directed DNA polymerase